MRVIFAVAIAAAILAVQEPTVFGQGKKDKKQEPKIVEPVSEVLGKPIEHWIKDLNHTDPGKSLFAVEAILKFSAEKAALALPAMIDRLGKYPPPQFTSIQILDPSLRSGFVRAIGAILAENRKSTHFQAGLQRLKASLRDPQFPVRIRALESLALLGFQAVDAAKDIITVAKDTESWELRRAALIALAAVGNDPKTGLKRDISFELYLAAEKDPCFQVRLASLEAMFNRLKRDDAKAKAEFETRVDLLSGTDADPMVVLSANWALMNVKDAILPKNIKQITELMDHPDSTVRIRAIEIATKIGIMKTNNAFIPALIKRVDDKELNVRLVAIQALGANGKLAKSAIGVLEGLLDDKQSAIQGAAIAALGSMGSVAGPSVGAIIKKMANPDLELVTINALAHLGEFATAAVDPLINKLSDTNLNIRRAAMIALGKIGDKKAIAPLLKWSNDLNPFVQMMAIEALGHMGPKGADAVKQLISRLRDKDQNVREMAIWALGAIGAGEAALPLSEQLSDANASTVRITLHALAAMKSSASAAAPAIAKKLDSKDNEIVALSIEALAWIGPAGKNSSVAALQKFAENMSHPEYLRVGALQAIDDFILEKNKKEDRRKIVVSDHLS